MKWSTLRPAVLLPRVRLWAFQRRFPDVPWLTEAAVHFLDAWLGPGDAGVVFRGHGSDVHNHLKRARLLLHPTLFEWAHQTLFWKSAAGVFLRLYRMRRYIRWAREPGCILLAISSVWQDCGSTLSQTGVFLGYYAGRAENWGSNTGLTG